MPASDPMIVAALCIAAHAALLLGLGLWVSVERGRTNTFHGMPDDSDIMLYKLVRAHGNTAEYAAALMVLTLLLAMIAQSPRVLWMMVVAVGLRYLFAAGIIFVGSMKRTNVLRFVGALGTYIVGTLMIIEVVIAAFTAN